MLFSLKDCNICVVGLGYVGLPLALEFSKKFNVIGYDTDKNRIKQLSEGCDRNSEVSNLQVKSSNINFVSALQPNCEANVYIITVPTPVDGNKSPDLSILKKVSRTIGRVLSVGDAVIYESTVYPGVTEDVCVPILTRESGLTLNTDYFVGYSPERINPGDKSRELSSIMKVTSGSTEDAAEFIDQLYSSIISAGTHKAPSIRIAEAAKVIENVQRDVNIALMNEFSSIFDSLAIDTHDVLEAAKTKWNFIPFQPGLVGGHCIGVDPFYLIHKADEVGAPAKLMKEARNINDGMPLFVVQKLERLCDLKNINPQKMRILILGCSFKENCSDTRNSLVMPLFRLLTDRFMKVEIEDHVVDAEDVMTTYGIKINTSSYNFYDIVILAVPHDTIIEGGVDKIKSRLATNGIFFDLKSVFDSSCSDLRL